MIFKYILIPIAQAELLGLVENRFKVDSGKSVIVNQTDILTYGAPEDSIEDKASKLGGRIISIDYAKIMITNTKK